MKLHYYPETDSLYIDLAEAISSESREVSEDLVVDYDELGHIVGLDIQHASECLNLSKIETEHLSLPISA